jgi:hypothetical protein
MLSLLRRANRPKVCAARRTGRPVRRGPARKSHAVRPCPGARLSRPPPRSPARTGRRSPAPRRSPP